MFNLFDLKVERKVKCEILQARFSIQKNLEDEETGRCFEQQARDEKLANVLQNQTSRFSKLVHRLLEREVRDSILQSMEEERQYFF